MRIFNNLEEIQKYYDKKRNAYVFKENEDYFSIELNFNLEIESSITAGNMIAGDIKAKDINALNIDACHIEANNINAWNINAGNIKAKNINARDIIAWDINAKNISFYAVCVSHKDIICNSIEAERKNHIKIALDGEIAITNKKGE